MTIRLRFVRQQPEADHTQSFFFEPESTLHFRAGQYLTYTLPHPGADARGSSRTFTIGSSPAEPLVRLTTRLSEPSSTFKQTLTRLTPGTILEASEPHGQFLCAATDTPAVFIAGGIGITPFRSILGDLAARKLRTDVTLLYSNSTSDIPFRAFFDSLVPDWPELKLVYTVTRPTPSLDWQGPTGRIDAEFIRQHVDDLSRPVYLVCGPTALVDAMRATLSSIGVDPSRIRHEGFPGYEPARKPALAVR